MTPTETPTQELREKPHKINVLIFKTNEWVRRLRLQDLDVT